MHSIIKSSLFSLGLLLCLTAQASEYNKYESLRKFKDVQAFNSLKNAVICHLRERVTAQQKGDPAFFGQWFNEEYPEPTRAAVLELARHVDYITDEEKCFLEMEIGKKKIQIFGKVATIISHSQCPPMRKASCITTYN